jgi:ADP-ribose pyrophosphatase YjhB (NUDIX family)
MRPALAFPFNDPDGRIFHHLQVILPDLKAHFERAYICPPLPTWKHVDHMEQLQGDDFFTVFQIDRELQIGDHFAHLYRRAADAAHLDQVIHLCFLDRLAFALEGKYRDAFLADIDSLSTVEVPLIFQRSPTAWETHPQNYRELEGIVTTVGRNLFERDLDYAWCHIAVRAGQLREIMPLVKNPDLSMVAEMILYLQHNIHTRDVDWLAWEDPFILGREPTVLKHERQSSLTETHKRLSYVLPMVQTLMRFSQAESMKKGLKVEQPINSHHPKSMDWTREIFSLSQSGLTYSGNQYDIERYKRLQQIAAEMIASQSEISKEAVLDSFSMQAGYITPKVDVRGAVVRDGKILLIQERADEMWAMPGGWADLGNSPASVAEREVWEESGFRVRAEKVVAVIDANRIEPMEFYHAYKIIFLCKLLDGEPRTSHETLAVDFFDPNHLPPLSVYRTNEAMLQEVYAHVEDPDRPTAFD